MAIYNTSSDSANTGIRAFLTKAGEYYWKQSFNTGSGTGKKIWEHIRDEVFNAECIYCGTTNSKLQIEHLVMFNRAQFGLHHPGNIAPTCSGCNNRRRDENKQYLHWEDHLREVCRENNQSKMFTKRKNKIKSHMNKGKYKYPNLSKNEEYAIRIIAGSLYENIKGEITKSLSMYEDLDRVFVKGK